MQELTYIRPLRMLSPAKFVGGGASDPLTQNSCPTGWGKISQDGVDVTCAGTTGISGTGRWQYVETVEDGEGAVQRVVFKLNPDHWDAPAGNVIEYMHLVRYKDHTAVKAALLDGSLDAVVGSGVLAPADVEEFRTR